MALSRLRRAASPLLLFAMLASLVIPSTLLSVPVTYAADQPTLVVVPGTIQSKLGCDGDWKPDCQKTALTYNKDYDVWTGTFDLPAGDYEYKVAINGTWTENYGKGGSPNGANITLSLAKAQKVKFYFDYKTHWITDNVNSVIVTAPGSYQKEIGCPDDWKPECLRSWLQDPDGDGTYTWVTKSIPAGNYEAKAAINEAWDENYGANGEKNGSNIAFSVPTDNAEIEFKYNSTTHLLSIATPQKGSLGLATAQWISRDTIAWSIPRDTRNVYKLHYDPNGGLTLKPEGITGGQAITLTPIDGGLTDAERAKWPNLIGYSTFRIAPEDMAKVPDILKGQIAVSAIGRDGKLMDATALQIAGALDDLYTYDGPLGVTFQGNTPTIRVWAPTARNVTLQLFDNSTTPISTTIAMASDSKTGVWTAAGKADWYGKYYVFGVDVYTRVTNKVEHNLVTDPYSVSLSMNSTRSQIINLDDPKLMPAGWQSLKKPTLNAPEDIAIYELHIRDFSATDQTVPAAHRGKYLAFTDAASDGMTHLRALADAGLTHVHIMPAFDIATINEDPSQRQDPDMAALAAMPPDSDQQQAAIEAVKDKDSYNWGYDPYHYNTPEGSYATNPDGSARIVEFRQMVKGLSDAGLRVVMDVVYNHTNASGQDPKSVLDKIVPGYYHRLSKEGMVETSTCCQNTASEHAMMEKLMIDSAVMWAKYYKVDGFRFDLMGHHMKSNMVKLQDSLHALTMAKDGVDGSKIYIYGEGWNFGEVADNARGVNATQINMAGTGIGTFNDRIRDGARGGSPFTDRRVQGYLTGLALDPNGFADNGTPVTQTQQLLLEEDWIRVGLAGNLKDFTFVDRTGATVKGSDVMYNGAPAGYTADPQEDINYVEAHDNETLWDAIAYKLPVAATMTDRVRVQQLGMDLVSFGEGVPFFLAGTDLLRSKSLDGNSYNSGDWFNRLDWTMSSNNWGVGLPMKADNGDRWNIMKPLLANPALKPAQADISKAAMHFQEDLRIRKSSPLFRLQTAQDIMSRVQFQNTGPSQVPGLIVMSISDKGLAKDLDPNYDGIVVLFNANPAAQSFTLAGLSGTPMHLHPVQMKSDDPVVRTATFDKATGKFTVPGRTTAVFVLDQAGAPGMPTTGQGEYDLLVWLAAIAALALATGLRMRKASKLN